MHSSVAVDPTGCEKPIGRFTNSRYCTINRVGLPGLLPGARVHRRDTSETTKMHTSHPVNTDLEDQPCSFHLRDQGVPIDLISSTWLPHNRCIVNVYHRLPTLIRLRGRYWCAEFSCHCMALSSTTTYAQMIAVVTNSPLVVLAQIHYELRDYVHAGNIGISFHRMYYHCYPATTSAHLSNRSWIDKTECTEVQFAV